MVVAEAAVIRAGTGTAALVSTTGASLSTVIKTAAAVAQIADDPTKNELMGRRRRRGSRRKRAIMYPLLTKLSGGKKLKVSIPRKSKRPNE